MGFLDRMRSDQQSDLKRGWKVLDSLEQLSQLVEDSHQKPIAIFKHSVTCGISAMSKYQLESDWDFREEELDFYYLDLLSNRNISNQVADELGVVHQSPQVILLKDGEVVYHASHHAIGVRGLRSYL
ncbi:MAG: bacillithiol system redox-active protein YtxJ [Bacteroidota bacterium]